MIKTEFLPSLGQLNADEDRTVCGRRKRQLVPSEQKDDQYWQKRKKNNDAARRSREKRRANDMIMERRLQEVQKENAALKAQLYTLQVKYGEITPFNSIQNTLLMNTQLHQQAHNQAMQAAALAAKQRQEILMKMSSVNTEQPMAKMTPEVTLPDGRKMVLDNEDQRPPSPATSDSSNHIIVDDEVDVDDSGNFKVSGSSGVSSDNESIGKKSAQNSADSNALREYYRL